MRVQYNFAKNKSWRDFVDVSKFTGMEVEHGLNTAGLHPENAQSNLGHFDPNGDQQNNFSAFSTVSNKKFQGIKGAAFQ